MVKKEKSMWEKTAKVRVGEKKARMNVDRYKVIYRVYSRLLVFPNLESIAEMRTISDLDYQL